MQSAKKEMGDRVDKVLTKENLVQLEFLTLGGGLMS
jgi:hypothetical protein